MQPKSLEIKKLLIIFLLVLFIIQIFFVFSTYVAWAAEPKDCPIEKDKVKCPAGTKIKLQIGIPGMEKVGVKSCTYTDKEGKTKTLYCVSDLPHYILALYKFFVGIAGIIATIMIMIGGMQWMLAAGNTEKISGAKSTIMSAVIGLALTLGSYTLLNFISPRLVELRLEATPVGSIEYAYWCRNLSPETKLYGKVGGLYPKQHPGYGKNYWTSANDDPKAKWRLYCGNEYTILGPGKNQRGFCYGSTCLTPEEEICVNLKGGSGKPTCVGMETICVSNQYECAIIDEMIKEAGISNMGCGLRKDDIAGVDWANADECVFGEVIKCPKDHTRVGCLEPLNEECGPIKKTSAIRPGVELKTYCIEPPQRAILGAKQGICCIDNKGNYVLHFTPSRE